MLFRIQPDRRGIDEMSRTFNMMRRATTGLAAIFVGGVLGKGLLGFNSRMSDAKDSLAGMLSLAKKTDLADQVGNANKLYDDLREKAATLPGSTEDYVNMLGMLVQPLADAGASIEQMETVTVNAMIAARGLHEGWQKAGRDLSEFINFGKMNQVDTFIRRLLEPLGYTQDKKKELKAMTKEARLKIALTALTQRQITQLGDAQAKSFSGQMDKMRDSLKMFLGRVGLPLFRALQGALASANDWLKKNEKTVDKFADAIGGGLKSAFGAVAGVVKFFIEHADVARAALRGLIVLAGILAGRMVAGWLIFAGPLARVALIVTAVSYVFQKLADFFGNKWVAAVVTVGLGLTLLKLKALTSQTWSWVRSLLAAAAAAKVAGAAQGASRGTSAAGAAVNALSGMTLGPAGRAAGGAATRRFARGVGKAAAVILPALGPIGAAVGAAIAVSELLDMLPKSDFGKAVEQYAEMHDTSTLVAMSKLYPIRNDRRAMDEALGAQTNNINININGVKDAGEMTPAMIEALEKQLRHTQNDVSGGKR